ncbi:hypothetical protein FJ976_24040 [Mesorhizobium sp. B1-1-9]|uniref:hypothetical protein n=1 Tax=Mesorhizobium sp. B1-1-9 TaxID=2589975 RepID=UPI0011269C6D|nr:hypothetical protein [Mesorhizobium sp. B1-1-9]TPN45308.1 hypothetical protein FJ976_24040 [Mesorhizobium sp. B1-1-9]
MPAKGSSAETQTEAERIAPAQVIEAIQRKADGFKARDRELLASQLEMEQAGVRPQESRTVGPEPREMAATLLNGMAIAADRDPTPGEELHKIIVERKAIEIALDALAGRENQARIIAAAEVLQESASDWREIVRQRAMCVLALRRVNAEAFAFRERIRRLARTNPNLICDVSSGPLFGPAVVGDHAYTYLEACVKAGIISRSEIDNAA